MSHTIHALARTTPVTRAEIRTLRQAGHTQRSLMERYNVSKPTILRWEKREETNDRSHRPHTLHTTLCTCEEIVVAELRRTLELSLDDLLLVTRRFINSTVSRSGLSRLLRREGLGSIRAMRATREKAESQANSTPTKKGFKDYEPGFIHIDIKYLPKMPDEKEHRYLFVAIDRATRWVFIHVYDNQTQESSVDFLSRLRAACKVKIQKILTDNGTQFTDRFTSKEKKPSGTHDFDQACAKASIEHRLIPPRHPQTNGMVERFNGRISELCHQTRFKSSAELEQTLMDYQHIYNYHIPQQALGYKSPVAALIEWHSKRPDLFLGDIINQTERDTYVSTSLTTQNRFLLNFRKGDKNYR